MVTGEALSRPPEELGQVGARPGSIASAQRNSLDKGTEYEQRRGCGRPENKASFGFTVSVDMKCEILIKTNYKH